jgi:hypothetical protein
MLQQKYVELCPSRLLKNRAEPGISRLVWVIRVTVFNRLQIPRFLSHWQTLASQIQNPNELRIVEDVKELAVRCEGSVRLYLRELLMLGFDLSERTISRWMKRAPRDPAEPSAGEPSFEPSGSDCGHGFLYCANDYVRRALRFFIISHDRRRILRVNVTKHPTSGWGPNASRT